MNSIHYINPSHPRIKNRDSNEQFFRDEIIKTLKEGKIKRNEYYDRNPDTEYTKRPTTKKRWISEVDGGHYTKNHLERRLLISRLLDNKESSSLSFEDKILTLINTGNTYSIVKSLPYLTGLTRNIAFALIEKGQLWDVVTHISSFTGLSSRDCEKIASQMLESNGFHLINHLHEFPIVTQNMVDKMIESKYSPYEVVEHLEAYKEKGIDPKNIVLKLIEIKHHYLVAEHFTDTFGGWDLGLDIIHKVLSTPDDGSITSYLPNIISEESLSKLPATLFGDNKFVALVLSVSPDLYDKIDNPHKAFIKKIVGMLKGKNIGSIDMNIEHGVVSYIHGTSRNTGAGMEYGNYVRAIYNGEEKQIHVVYRDGYSQHKDNWDLCFSGTEITSVQDQGDNIIITVKAKKGDTYAREYTFTYKKAEEVAMPILNETEQEEFLTLLEQTKSTIAAGETGKYDGCTMTPYFTSEKTNAEKGVAVIVLFKQIDYSITASGNQYAYEAFKVTKDGSYTRIDYKAARDYDRKAGNNIVIDAEDYKL